MERKYVLRKPVPLRHYRVDYDRELNEEQREVVLAGGGPLLVIAGAGSGKTRTLVYRVSRLIESGTDPSRIVLLTFTNKAAREMLRRVDTLLTVDTRRMLGGTFHSVGNRLLRRFGARVGLPDIPDQASFVAQRLLEWHDEGEKLAELAVLYRAHYQALELQIELTRRGIPYEIRSGTRFFEQRHVKDVLAFLKIVVNPKDELSWKRALKLFPRVGERSAWAVWEAIGGRPDPLASFREREGTRGIDLPRGAAAALQPFRGLVGRLESPSLRSSPAEAIRAVVDGVYRDFARARFPNAETRLDELEQFAQFAQSYESLPAFLEEVTLFHELSGEDVVAGEPEDDRVVLSSIHQAKGLEWSRVVLMGLSEGRFPSYRSANTDAGLEEERRLFYVAVTRAKNEVHLVYPMLARDRYGVDVILEPSRFLAELPPEVYERWTIQSESETESGAVAGDAGEGGPGAPRGAQDPVN